MWQSFSLPVLVLLAARLAPALALDDVATTTTALAQKQFVLAQGCAGITLARRYFSSAVSLSAKLLPRWARSPGGIEVRLSTPLARPAQRRKNDDGESRAPPWPPLVAR
ncbi:hypothetical protein THAOC_22690 [Thalassiosira oceanica]|uniref:Uncharacterized protein n=1 Tax=Thalassiosira oceanica TaxID=159749 RepID=K0RTX1_THAOC|nr:hypothetical protein THAOC_22690 [Thalassiosira oceanica]|eukprot:EJK57283.1 hypothetical protein THAOC_22690 [Thalassiosira oceanica]